MKPSIAFIGAGNMASSLIGGLIADEYDPNAIWATNPNAEKLAQLRTCFHVHTTSNNLEAAEKADILVFAVKPPVLKQVLLELAPVIQRKQPLLISVVTGIQIASVVKWLGTKAAVVRCMPNTPALVGAGASALFANEHVTAEQKELAESILRAVGITLWVKREDELEIITALSGSGPAYFFLFIEALQEGGIKLGLDEETASLLTVQTALGAARMVLESNKDVVALRKQVTSPGGTTEQAIRVLEEGNIRDLFYSALQAAKKRAVEIQDLLQ